MNNYNTNVNQNFRYNQPTPSNINNNHQWNNNGNNFQNRPPTYIFPPQNINFHNNQNQSQNTRHHFNHNIRPPSNNSNTHTQQFQNLNNDIFNNRNNYSKISQPNDFKNELKYLIETYSENKECPLSPINKMQQKIQAEFANSIQNLKKKKYNISIPEFRSKLNTIINLNKDLKNNLETRSIEESISIQQRIKKLKDELTPNDISDIKIKLRRIENKRNRIKRVKKRIDLERRENEDARKDMHQRIDHRLQMISNLDDNKRKDCEMKHCTDKVMLSLISRSKEVKADLCFLDSLLEYREANKIPLLQKGIICSVQEDLCFKEKFENMKRIASEQLDYYNSQISKLEVIQEKERLDEIDEKHERDFNDRLSKTKNALFCTESDTKEIPLDSLIEIRRDWDCYISLNDNNISQAIPPMFVVPSNPSNSTWEQYLVESDD